MPYCSGRLPDSTIFCYLTTAVTFLIKLTLSNEVAYRVSQPYLVIIMLSVSRASRLGITYPSPAQTSRYSPTGLGLVADTWQVIPSSPGRWLKSRKLSDRRCRAIIATAAHIVVEPSLPHWAGLLKKSCWVSSYPLHQKDPGGVSDDLIIRQVVICSHDLT